MAGSHTNSGNEEESNSTEAQIRIREQLHSVQIGLDLLRREMLAGKFRSAEDTYSTIVQCLGKISNDDLLAGSNSDDSIDS